MPGFLKKLLGGGARKPVKISPFAEKLPVSLGEQPCDGVTIENVASYEQLRSILRDLQSAHPGSFAFMGFDDVGQAAYTSGHVTISLGLDDLEGRDLSAYDQARFDPEDALADCPELFPERLANFLAYVEKADPAISDGSLSWTDPDVTNDILSAHRDPDAVLHIASERDFFVQFAPVERAAQVLAAFPNGYFTGDLTPAQNNALAQRMDDEFGLKLDGIGSSFLSFGADRPLSEEKSREAARTVLALYADAPAGAEDELAALLAGRDWLLVRYTQ